MWVKTKDGGMVNSDQLVEVRVGDGGALVAQTVSGSEVQISGGLTDLAAQQRITKLMNLLNGAPVRPSKRRVQRSQTLTAQGFQTPQPPAEVTAIRQELDQIRAAHRQGGTVEEIAGFIGKPVAWVEQVING